LTVYILSSRHNHLSTN